MSKLKPRKGSVGGYMLTESQLTELIEKSTVKATDSPVHITTKGKKNGKEQK